MNIVVAMAIPGAAMAQDTRPSTEKAPDPNKKIYREQRETGTRFTTKTCHTAADWAQIDANNSNIATDALRRNRSGAN